MEETMTGMSLARLRYGPLDDVAYSVDMQAMDEMELRSVILNLIAHVEQLEKRVDQMSKDGSYKS
jgi:hypothetical protein